MGIDHNSFLPETPSFNCIVHGGNLPPSPLLFSYGSRISQDTSPRFRPQLGPQCHIPRPLRHDPSPFISRFSTQPHCLQRNQQTVTMDDPTTPPIPRTRLLLDGHVRRVIGQGGVARAQNSLDAYLSSGRVPYHLFSGRDTSNPEQTRPLLSVSWQIPPSPTLSSPQHLCRLILFVSRVEHSTSAYFR